MTKTSTLQALIELTGGKAPKEAWSDDHLLYPTDLCRVSPFKPMKRGYQRRYVSKEILFQTPFGKLAFAGPELSMRDEDIFMAVMKLARPSLLKAADNLTVTTSWRGLMKYIGLTPTGPNRENIEKSLIRLRSSHLILSTKKVRMRSIGFIDDYEILSDGSCCIHINKDICQFYEAVNEITQIHYGTRKLIKGDIAKALHKFLSSQRSNRVFTIGTEAMIPILNMNPDRELKENRREIREAINELVRVQFLENPVWNTKDSCTVDINPKF